MQELIFEIPISRITDDFPIKLLQRSKVLHMLQFDTKGYVFICTLSIEHWNELRDSPMEMKLTRKISVKNLGKEKSGSILLQVTGRWLGRGEKLDPRQKKAFEFFKSMERSPIYGLDTPEITDRGIVFKVAAEADRISQLLNGLRLANVPVTVEKLGRFRARNESVLDTLTIQQSRVLRLAHIMGYYDIPRKTSTSDLAQVLVMQKATVGEHLRRAEKHVFDKIFS